MDTPMAIQAIMQDMPWHRQGLFMGMHWGWWLFWVVALAGIVWAFWRLREDSREARRYARERLDAEDELRARYARGEIGEDQFLQRMQVLQDSRAG